MPRHISEEKINNLLETYKANPMSIKEAAVCFGICEPVVSKILKKHGIKQWSRAKVFSPDLDEDYFSQIDNHEKAYFLGLITTDGCVFWKNKKQAFLAVELQESDKYIIQHFLKCIHSNRKLIYNERTNTYATQIHSTIMVQDLSKYYIQPRSSFTQEFCNFLQSQFMPDYIRGIFDGDGSFSFYARGNGRSVHKKSVRIFSGNKQFLQDMSLFLSNNLGVTIPATGFQKNCYAMSWYKNQDNFSIIEYIYSTEGPYLARKKHIADKIVNEIRQYRDNRSKIRAAS